MERYLGRQEGGEREQQVDAKEYVTEPIMISFVYTPEAHPLKLQAKDETGTADSWRHASWDRE